MVLMDRLGLRAVIGEAAALIDAGLIRPLPDPQRFKLTQAQQAHELVSGSARGKVVVDIE
ncbi:zinc-binding dehydrogenase [Paucibacter sp. PLA-PC-4]|nr:zinc-binding dehydrogenase [Paucibacter sp. PLA-PC-4]